MHLKNHKAFTMIELVFVIVIIGVLSAIAIPKFSTTGKLARTAKAGATLASVRMALSTERQKRILRGNTVGITDLGTGTTYAFSYFDNNSSFPVLQYPVDYCTGEGCWERVDATTYRYHISSTEKANFKLDKNRLDCSDDDTTQCNKISK